jgi:S1-C subfamily serine protease
VVAIGNAGGVGGAPAVAAGIVTALGQQITATDTNGSNAQHLTGLIETDAAIQPGDSGGPLADMQARVIGMDTAATLGHLIGGGQTSDHGFAIPIQHALAIAHQIQAGHGSSTIHIGTRGMIGVQVADISAGSGADVQQVTAGSPADRAGIRPGDTIVAIDGHAVTTSASLSTLIRKHRPGEKVSVDWTSADGSRHHALITLVPGPPD